LQLQACPVGLLNDAVGGDLSRSHVWREVMSRYGIGDVASAVFADQYGCWGFLDLWRGDTRGPFDGTDAEFIATQKPGTAAAAPAIRLSCPVWPTQWTQRRSRPSARRRSR
jgi:hypothetical protein